MTTTEPTLDKLETSAAEDFDQQITRLLQEPDTVAGDPRLDDRDLPLAANYAEWLLSPRFTGTRPFQKQVEYGLRIFGEVCPVCSPGFWSADPVEGFDHRQTPEEFVDRLTMLEYGRCPKCGGSKRGFVRRGLVNDYTGAIIIAGQRASKSVTTTQLSAYVLHRYLKLRNPAAFFGLLDRQGLEGTFTASDFSTAKTALMDLFVSIVSDAPWFRQYHEWLADRGNLLGRELYRVRDTFVFYRHKSITVKVSAPNARNLRGRTRFLTAIDELGWLSPDDDKIKISGLELQTALSNSLLTLRAACRRKRQQSPDDVPFPLELTISSPRDVNDPIETLYRRFHNSKTYFCVRAPTWKINPEVPKSELRVFFEANPQHAWRDYGARPPMSAAAFVDTVTRFEAALTEQRAAWSQEQHRVHTRTGHSAMTARLAWRWSDATAVGKLLSLDLGFSNNSMAWSVLHLDEKERLVIDGMGEVMPHKTAPVSLPHVFRNCLLPIIEKMGVVAVVCDAWQSKKLLQELEDRNVLTAELRLPYDAFVTWREDCLYAGNLRLPRLEIPLDQIEKVRGDYRKAFENRPLAHFVYQAITVVDRGRTVDKGNGLTDDLFRTVVLGHHAIMSDQDLRDRVSGPVNQCAELPLASPVRLHSSASVPAVAAGQPQTPLGSFGGVPRASAPGDGLSIGSIGSDK